MLRGDVNAHARERAQQLQVCAEFQTRSEGGAYDLPAAGGVVLRAAAQVFLLYRRKRTHRCWSGGPPPPLHRPDPHRKRHRWFLWVARRVMSFPGYLKRARAADAGESHANTRTRANQNRFLKLLLSQSQIRGHFRQFL